MEKFWKSGKRKTTSSLNEIKAAGTKKMITNTEGNEKTWNGQKTDYRELKNSLGINRLSTQYNPRLNQIQFN